MGRDSTQCVVMWGIQQRVGYVLGNAAGFEVFSNSSVFLVRDYFGNLLVIENSWIGGLLATLSLGNIYFHLKTINTAETS